MDSNYGGVIGGGSYQGDIAPHKFEQNRVLSMLISPFSSNSC